MRNQNRLVRESDLINAPTTVLAVDPGLSGAVCKMGRGEFVLIRDFKTFPDIAKAIQKLSYGVSHAVMEFVHAMPGQGVCSMFSFGRAAGVADGALALCLPEGCESLQVSPQKWQNFFRTRMNIPKSTEFDSRLLASKLLPNFLPFFLRKKDHNSADATLMAICRMVEVCGL